MTTEKAPMLLDVFRLTTSSERQTTANIIRHQETAAGGFNYNRSATFTEKAYGGYRNFPSLYAQCEGDGSSVAKVHNTKVLRATAPLSDGRDIQTFPFSKRTITLAPGLVSNLGPRFFFVEGGVVKLYNVHARNNYRAERKDFAGLAWACKQEILDQDFFGQPSDVEFVDVDKRGDSTSVVAYGLDDLLPFLVEPPEETIARFVKCFRKVREEGLAKPKERRKPKERPSSQLNLGI